MAEQQIEIIIDISRMQENLQKRLDMENIVIENYLMMLLSQGVPHDAIEIVAIQSANACGYFRFVRVDERKLKPYNGLIGNYLKPFNIEGDSYGKKND